MRATWIIVASVAAVGLSAGVVDFAPSDRLVELEDQLDQLTREYQRAAAAEERWRAEVETARERIGLTEASVDELVDQFAEREARLARLEERPSLSRESLKVEMEALDARVEERIVGLQNMAERALEGSPELAGRLENLAVLIEDTRDLQRQRERDLLQQLDEVQHTLDPDLRAAELREQVLAPVVQLQGDRSVGSGVLLRSTEHPDGTGGHQTLALTAWHVVRDIQTDPTDPVTPVPVRIYKLDGGLRTETATVLEVAAHIDFCLLELDTREPVPNGAHLCGVESLDRLQVFDEVVAVGCPLGTDPLPTSGELSSLNHRVDGSDYWMINAPTYIGNSGGGIFEGRGHGLIGIFSKIYNHGAVRPTIVPHMGLVTPMTQILPWLEGRGWHPSPTGGLYQVEQLAEVR